MKRENRVRKHGKKYYKLTVDGKVYLVPERLGNYALENGVSEQALRQRQQQVRLARKRRSEENLRKYSVCSKWFEHLEKNNLIATVKTDRYGQVQRG